MNSEMDIRGYKPADETFYDYKDEEETPRGTHHTKEDDEAVSYTHLTLPTKRSV